MQTPWKVISAFVGVFVGGAVFGGLFSLRTTAPTAAQPGPAQPAKASGAATRGPSITPAMLRHLRDRLKLTDEQARNIEPLVARADEDLRLLRRENFEGTTRVMNRLHDDMMAWLTPEQVDHLERIRRNTQQRLRDAQDRPPEPQLGVEADEIVSGTKGK